MRILKRRFGGGDEKDKNMFRAAAIGIIISTIVFCTLLAYNTEQSVDLADECAKPEVTCSAPQGGVITLISLGIMVTLFLGSYRYMEKKRMKNWRSYR